MLQADAIRSKAVSENDNILTVHVCAAIDVFCFAINVGVSPSHSIFSCRCTFVMLHVLLEYVLHILKQTICG